MNPGKNLPLLSRASPSNFLWRSHVSSLDATHLYVNIGCHVNLIGFTVTFDIQNESRHFEWRDSSMSHVIPFDVTDFESKSADFLIIYCFSITKNK
jgi:hypothetical protein